jgi:hypothetical protein
VSVLSGYVLDAIVIWGSEFNQRVQVMKDRGLLVGVGACVGVLLLHLFLFEFYFFWLLQREYAFSCRVYHHMIPESLLLKEKVIVQQLINEGFLDI